LQTGIAIAEDGYEGLSRKHSAQWRAAWFQARVAVVRSLPNREEKMATENEKHLANLAFDRFRSMQEVPSLLILDCETRRFTIEQPSSPASFRQWCQEVDHATASGRNIVCVPVNRNNKAEIEAMGTGLGYSLWPPRTIVPEPDPLPAEPEAKQPAPDSEARAARDDDQRRRLLARMGLP
jgi:hypothetical protein